MSTQRWAPVQGEYDSESRVRIASGRIPWELHELAWRAYADAGFGDQSAERIAERHGFGWSELIALIRGEYKRDGFGRAADELFGRRPCHPRAGQSRAVPAQESPDD